MPLCPDRAQVYRNLGRIDTYVQCVSRNIDSVCVRSATARILQDATPSVSQRCTYPRERRKIAIKNDAVKVLQATG
jgi:hypothetical protein